MQIEGVTALVSGANRGIGRAMAEALLARGAAKVYAAVRDPAAVTDPRLVPVQVDVTDAARVRALAEEAGDVALVVNNAGGTSGPAFPLGVDLDAARFDLELNYLGLVAMTQAFAPVLARNGGGAFVNVLSVVSWAAVPFLSPYAAAKAAAWSYSNAARLELKGQGTEVVGVHVGFVDTDLTAGLEFDKVAPSAVAVAALDALAAGAPEAIVDDFSRLVKGVLADDQRALYPLVEERFAARA
jgi:NAD(P)-dependent dehydrogenase (short-subunit alcohol dehydrogenase family)